MRLFIAPCLLLLAVLLVPALPSFSESPDAHARQMRRKLEYSQQILDGLVTEDFEKMRNAATSLNELGKRKWIENESTDDRTQNQVFWFTTGTLLMAAEKKNLDGALLSYTQMTHSCVNCHQLLRRQ